MPDRPWFLPEEPDSEDERIRKEMEDHDADLALIEHHLDPPPAPPDRRPVLSLLGKLIVVLVLLAVVVWIALEVGGFIGEGHSLEIW